jgi:hypothetical protein
MNIKYATITLFTSVLLINSSPIFAEEPIDSYSTKLSAQDHTNSDGVKLTSVADIIRQDRANYHKFNIRDAEDQTDTVFGDAESRERIPAMLKKGHIDKQTKNIILKGTPVVWINIYSNHIDVSFTD